MAFRWAGADDPRTGPVGYAQTAIGRRAGGARRLWRLRYVRMGTAEPGVRRGRWRQGRLAPYRCRRHVVGITPEVAHWAAGWRRWRVPTTYMAELIAAAIPVTTDDTPGTQPRRDVRKQLEALLDARGGVSRITVRRPYGHPERGMIPISHRRNHQRAAGCRSQHRAAPAPADSRGCAANAPLPPPVPNTLLDKTAHATIISGRRVLLPHSSRAVHCGYICQGRNVQPAPRRIHHVRVFRQGDR